MCGGSDLASRNHYSSNLFCVCNAAQRSRRLRSKRKRRSRRREMPATSEPTVLRCRDTRLRQVSASSVIPLITHTHQFKGRLSGTTQVSQYQKGKTNLDFTEARDTEWQWNQLGHMQVCTSLQTTTPAPHHSVFCRPDALPAAQPTASKHCNTTSHWQEF